VLGGDITKFTTKNTIKALKNKIGWKKIFIFFYFFLYSLLITYIRRKILWY
jgi:hypothetical protein